MQNRTGRVRKVTVVLRIGILRVEIAIDLEDP
jgi:hypothetical protein